MIVKVHIVAVQLTTAVLTFDVISNQMCLYINPLYTKLIIVGVSVNTKLKIA